MSCCRRKQLGISQGDLLEARVERGKLTYTRKSVVDRAIPAGKSARARIFKQLQEEAPEWLKSIQKASVRRGCDKLTMRQIDAEISAARRERRARARRPPSRGVFNPAPPDGPAESRPRAGLPAPLAF